MRLFRPKFRGKQSKSWWCAWPEHGKTEKRSTKCTTRAAAELVAARWERARADPDHAAKDQATVAVEAQVFLEKKRRTVRKDGTKTPAGTMNMYECKVGHLVRLLPPRLADVNVPSVDEYFDTRAKEGAEVSTLYKEWVALRGILESAARRGAFDREISILKPEWVTAAYSPRQRFLTWPQLDALVDELAKGGEVPEALRVHARRAGAHVHPLERAIAVAFIVGAGPRRAEFWRASAEDIETDRVRVRGTKTEASKRENPIPEEFETMLTAASIWLSAKPSGSFDPWANARRDLEAACRRIGTRMARAAGRDPKEEPAAWREYFAPVTFNDLRRTFGSLLVQAGVSNEVVSKLMGHTTTTMVDRVYGRQTHASLDALLRTRATRPSTPRKEGGGDA